MHLNSCHYYYYLLLTSTPSLCQVLVGNYEELGVEH